MQFLGDTWRRRGRTTILAGLAGLLAAGLLTQLVHRSYNLIVG